MTDPVADMLARIRNTIAVNKNTVVLPHSNLKEHVAKILVKNGFLEAVAIDKSDKFPQLKITIALEGRPPQITHIAKLSKPGRRDYVQSKEIPVVKRGRGLIVVSTSKGIMTGTEAKKAKIGGELICEVY